MVRVAVALGSNLGDRLGNLRAGLAGLDRIGSVTRVSRLYETDPVGGPDQGRYLNAVVLVETDLSPLDVLAALLEIEKSRGRERGVRWGPRTLDLDLIVYETQRLDLPTLEVPHPRAHERAFVLVPLREVWPDSTLANGSSVVEALDRLDASGVRAWEGAWQHEMPHMGREAKVWVGAQIALFALWLVVVLVTAVPLSTLRTVIGGIMVAVGVGSMEAARRALGRNLTPYPQPRQGTTLVDDGIYSRVRHPIYFGVVAALAGASVMAGSILGFAVASMLLVFFNAKSSVEERALSIAVPEYTEYLSSVERRFFPV